MNQLVDATVSGLGPYLDVPFAVFGHSLGALIAFEFARRVRGSSNLRHVFVSARQAPHLPDRRAPIAHLQNAEFIATVQERYGGIPRAVLESPDLLELLVPRLRADFEVLETYAYGPDSPLPCGISVFAGTGDTILGADLSAWQAHTTVPPRIRMVTGGHLYLESHRAELLAGIAEDLQPVTAGSGVSL